MKSCELSSTGIWDVNSKVYHWPSKTRVSKSWAMNTQRGSAISHINRF
jgi:hypothetical protein